MCEIDIVASKNEVIYFVEVKCRKLSAHGSGLEHITAKKLNQMKFAARCWVQANNWQNNYELSAIEVTGSELEITGFVENIT